MERPIHQPLGTRAGDLDTPALVVDVRVLDRNISTMNGFFAGKSVALRADVGAHLCPAVAQRQVGSTQGILVGTLSQAELFTQHGLDDCTIANPVVIPSKILRICHLAREARVTVNVDNARNVRDLAAAAQAFEITLQVLVALRSGPSRPGVAPGLAAVDLALDVARSPGLAFAGISGYGDPGPSADWFQRVVDTRELMEKAGLPVTTVSAGGTLTYEQAAATPGITEVTAGSYALSDVRHQHSFEPAARVLTRVISRPEPGLGLLDLGQKAIGTDTGLPAVDEPQGVRITRMNAEHGFLAIEPAAEGLIDLESRVWAVPFDGRHCMNLRDYVNVVRDGRLEAVWPVAGRGLYR